MLVLCGLFVGVVLGCVDLLFVVIRVILLVMYWMMVGYVVAKCWLCVGYVLVMCWLLDGYV